MDKDVSGDEQVASESEIKQILCMISSKIEGLLRMSLIVRVPAQHDFLVPGYQKSMPPSSRTMKTTSETNTI